MAAVTPPDQNIGVLQHLIGQAMLRHLQSGGADDKILVPAQHLSQGAVDALGVHLTDGFLVLLVVKLVPNGNTNGSLHKNASFYYLPAL